MKKTHTTNRTLFDFILETIILLNRQANIPVIVVQSRFVLLQLIQWH